MSRSAIPYPGKYWIMVGPKWEWHILSVWLTLACCFDNFQIFIWLKSSS